MADIVRAIRPAPDDLMVEIGPGLGALTRPLLQQLPHLHVVEIDRDIVARLHQEFSASKLTVHQADALKFDFAALLDVSPICDSELGPPSPSPLGGEGRGEGVSVPAQVVANCRKLVRGNENKLRVVGNLPYNISTPLLFHLSGYAERISDLHFMLQKEVVERMVAAPSTPDYGRLSVMLQCRFEMELLFIVPPEAFRPAPKVESAIVRMRPLERAVVAEGDKQLFAAIVAAAFSQRRKTLRNTLAKYLKQEDFAALEIDPQQRAENLSVADFVRITHFVGRMSAALSAVLPMKRETDGG